MLGELTLAQSGSDLALSFMPGLVLTWLGIGSDWPGRILILAGLSLADLPTPRPGPSPPQAMTQVVPNLSLTLALVDLAMALWFWPAQAGSSCGWWLRPAFAEHIDSHGPKLTVSWLWLIWQVHGPF